MHKSIFKLKKRSLIIPAFVIVFCLVLIIRIAYVQFFKGDELKLKSESQISSKRTITASRGTIFDATRRKYFGSKLNGLHNYSKSCKYFKGK